MNRVLRLKLLVLASDLLSLIVSYIVSNFLYISIFKQQTMHMKASVDNSLALFFVSFVIAEIIQLENNYRFLERTKRLELKNIIETAVIAFLVILSISFTLKTSHNLSRGVFFISFWVNILITYFSRVVLKSNFKGIMGNSLSSILVIGESRRIFDDFRNYKINKGIMSNIIGYCKIDDEQCICDVRYPELCETNQLVEFVRVNQVDAILVLSSVENINNISNLLSEIKSMGVKIHVGIDLIEGLYNESSQLNFIGEYPVITNAITHNKEVQLIIKRLFDILFGLVGSLITLLICIVLGPVIKIESKGPVFFKQTRVGKNGRRFTMYKFRSMGVDAEARKQDLLDQNEVEGHMFKMTNDPRVTKVGKFIRATSIDEFPQFFNILRGEMSLIGTRPPTLDEVIEYKSYHKRRLSMKPGLTGLWQVCGRSNIADFEEVVKLDLQYIDNFSLYNDLAIFLSTVKVVLGRVGSK